MQLPSLAAPHRVTVLACVALLSACGGGASPTKSSVRVSMTGFEANAVVPAGVGSLELLVTSPACGGPVIGWEVVNVSPGAAAPPFDLTLPAGQPACFELSAWSGPNTTGELRYHGVTPGVVLAPDGAVQVTITVLPVDPAPPTVATLPAAGISARTAIAQGSVDAGGNPALAWIEWGPTAAYGNTTPVQQVTASPFTMSAPLTGLQPSTTYHYRAVAAGGGQTVVGADVAFTTAAPEAATTVGVDFGAVSPPAVGAPSALRTTKHGVQIAAGVSPGGSATHAYFELAERGVWGRTSAVQALGAGEAQVALSGAFDGLALGTVYWFRAVAVNAGGVTVGAGIGLATNDGAWEAPGPVSADLQGLPSLAALPDGTLLAGGLLPGGAAVAVGGPAGWSAPEVVIPGANAPQVVATVDGRAVVAAFDVSGSTRSLVAAAGAPGAWSTPQVIDQWDSAGLAPRLLTVAAAGDGAVVLVWQRSDSVGGLKAVRWVEGAGFGAPVELDAEPAGRALVAGGPDGRVVVAWNTASLNYVRVREYVPGAGWGPTIRLAEESDQRRPLSDLSVGASGVAVLVWNHVDSTNTFGTMTVSRGTMWGWTPPQPIGPTGIDTVPNAAVAVAADGAAVVAWPVEGGGCQAAWLAVDGTWAAPEAVPLPSCDRPRLVLHPGGNGMLLSQWVDGGGNDVLGALRLYTGFRYWDREPRTLSQDGDAPAAVVLRDGSIAVAFAGVAWGSPVQAAWFR